MRSLPYSHDGWPTAVLWEAQLAFPGKGRLTPEQEELWELRWENADIHEERDILKKPARGGPSSRADVIRRIGSCCRRFGWFTI